MRTSLVNFIKRNPLFSVLLMATILSPVSAMAAGPNFISGALSTSQAHVVIQVLGGVGIALQLATIMQDFFAGNTGSWLSKGVGIAAGVVLIVQPSLLGTTMAAIGL